MKTIRQIADEIGVSKQAVRDEIKKQKMQSDLRKVGNQFTLTKQQGKCLKQAFSSRKTQSENANESQSDLQSTLHLYEILKEELEAKNRQIEELTIELAKEREHSRQQSEKISQLADQAQQLQLAQIAQTAEIKKLPKPSEKGIFHRLKFW